VTRKSGRRGGRTQRLFGLLDGVSFPAPPCFCVGPVATTLLLGRLTIAVAPTIDLAFGETPLLRLRVGLQPLLLGRLMVTMALLLRLVALAKLSLLGSLVGRGKVVARSVLHARKRLPVCCPLSRWNCAISARDIDSDELESSSRQSAARKVNAKNSGSSSRSLVVDEDTASGQVGTELLARRVGRPGPAGRGYV